MTTGESYQRNIDFSDGYRRVPAWRRQGDVPNSRSPLQGRYDAEMIARINRSLQTFRPVSFGGFWECRGISYQSAFCWRSS